MPTVVGGSAGVVFAGVFELWNGVGLKPRWIVPKEWYPFVDDYRRDRWTQTVRSVGCYGRPTVVDVSDAHPEYLFYPKPGVPSFDLVHRGIRCYATMWPRERESYICSVSLTANIVDIMPKELLPFEEGPSGYLRIPPLQWAKKWKNRAISTQAYPVYLRRTDLDLLIGSMTMCLWHGVRYRRWSAEPARTTDEFRIADLDAADLSGEILSRHAEGYRPISISGSGAGSDMQFYVSYGRKGNEAPLPRRWIVRSASAGQSAEGRVVAGDHMAGTAANRIDARVKGYMQSVLSLIHI